MDWYSWLCKSGLEPGLVYEYSLLFSDNELGRDDIAYFNHEFLQSMGISIAKHRLEILKLAKKETRPKSPRPVGQLLAAIARTKQCLAKYIRSFVHRDDAAIVVVKPRASSYGGGGGRRKGAMLKRSKQRLVFLKQGRLLLTDIGGCGGGGGGGSMLVTAPTSTALSVSRSASPMMVSANAGSEKGGDGDAFWGSGGTEEMTRWDSLFQNLKPT